MSRACEHAAGTEEGTYTFTIRLTNVDFPEATATQSFTINIAYDEKHDPEARSKISGEFRDGRVGSLYHSTTDVTFNWSGCKWEVESGDLPPGLHLSLLGFQGYDSEYVSDIMPTDHNADLRGTPTTAGEYTFTLRATRRDDERFTATKTFTIVISPAYQPDDPDDPDDSDDPVDSEPANSSTSSGGGGGGCNFGFSVIVIAALALLKRSR